VRRPTDLRLRRERPSNASNCRPCEAGAWHQLGVIAEVCCDYSTADQCLRRALAIREERRLIADTAGTLDELGRVARLDGRYDDSERWHAHAVQIKTQWRMWVELAISYANLGRLRLAQNLRDHAIREFANGFRVVHSVDSPVRHQLARDLARQLWEVGEEAFVAAWRAALPDDDPPMDLLRQALAQLREQADNAE